MVVVLAMMVVVGAELLSHSVDYRDRREPLVFNVLAIRSRRVNAWIDDCSTRRKVYKTGTLQMVVG